MTGLEPVTFFTQKQRRYQAALHPFQLVYSAYIYKVYENPFTFFQIVFFSIDIQLFLPFLFFFFYLYTHTPAAPINAYLLTYLLTYEQKVVHLLSACILGEAKKEM